MTMIAVIGATIARRLDAISANWDDIALTFPTGSGTNSDLTLSWTVGGSRSISTDYSGLGALSYRIDSGSWTAYSTALTVTSGQTVGWRYVGSGDESITVSVTDVTRGTAIDTFVVSASGFP